MSAALLMSAGDLAAAIRSGEASVPEVVDAHLTRIAALDPALHAFVAVREVAVRREAEQAQRRLDGGEPVGPLHGVPFTAKDILATTDPPARCGSLATPPGRAGPEATAVTRLREAGALLLGKTACPEFALGVDTVSPVTGSTGSPWGQDLTPGGSSGGEAAAVATGMSALGLGTDYGGSLRWPAACVGIVALRPTVGRVPGTGQLPGLPTPRGHRIPNPWSLQGALQVVGPLARTVADLALALGVLAGADGHDPAATTVPDLEAAEPDVAALRIGWLTEEDSTPVRDDVAEVVARVAAVLAGAGAQVHHAPGVLDGAHAAYNAAREADGTGDLRRFTSGRQELLGEVLRRAVEQPQPGPEALALAWAAASGARERVLEALGVPRRTGALDVLVAPVAPVPAFSRGRAVVVAGRELSGFALMGLCRAVTLTGLPSLSVPAGLSAEGLPVSVQLVGRPFAEATLLAVARVVEAATGPLRPPGPT